MNQKQTTIIRIAISFVLVWALATEFQANTHAILTIPEEIYQMGEWVPLTEILH